MAQKTPPQPDPTLAAAMQDEGTQEMFPSLEELTEETDPLHLDLLNPEQHQAVTHDGGTLLVLAGPGSGKTRVLTTRAAYLLSVKHVNPKNLVIVTFTNKAANEMKARLSQMVPDKADDVLMGTFHAVAARLLRRFGSHLGISSNFTIIDATDARKIMDRAVKEFKQKKAIAFFSRLDGKTMQRIISGLKCVGLSPVQVAAGQWHPRLDKYKWAKEPVSFVFAEYQRQLDGDGVLDFDDLLMHCKRLLEQNKTLLSNVEHVLVDEFQDTNSAQLKLTRLFASTRGKITVVGDPDQSIYGFRMADTTVFKSLQQAYKNATVVRLNQNYRSANHILKISSAVMNQQKDREQAQLWSQHVKGPPVFFSQYDSPRNEAVGIARQIVEILDKCRSLRLNDIAILLRVNAMTRSFEEVFNSIQLPYRLVGGVSFFERMEIRDLVCYLRLIGNFRDSTAFERIANVPRRGIGVKTLQDIVEKASRTGKELFEVAENHPSQKVKTFVLTIKQLRDRVETRNYTLEQLLDDILNITKFQDYLKKYDEGSFQSRWDNVQELKTVCREFSRDVTGIDAVAMFLEHAALHFSSKEDLDRRDAVTVSTIHSAKGLEWGAVFVAGCEENTLPHQWSIANPAELAEERRLLYVAMTRAKYVLVLSCCERRHSNWTGPSRFIGSASIMSQLVDFSAGFLVDMAASGLCPHDTIEPLQIDLKRMLEVTEEMQFPTSQPQNSQSESQDLNTSSAPASLAYTTSAESMSSAAGFSKASTVHRTSSQAAAADKPAPLSDSQNFMVNGFVKASAVSFQKSDTTKSKTSRANGISPPKRIKFDEA